MDPIITKQLDELVGKTIFYQSQNHAIKKWKLVSGNYCIVTNSRTLQFYPSEIQQSFLDMIDDEQVAHVIEKVQSSPNVPASAKEKEVMSIPEENITIKSALLDALKKIKDNPTFLQQAKGICEIANTMVNIQKTEIDIIKLQNDL